MKTKQIIDTLKEYNDWRRAKGKWDVDAFNAGESLFDTITAQKIGLTLDAAIEKLQTLERERDEARHIASYWRNMAGTFAISKRKNKFPWEEGSPWEEDS
jgi:hypothetical protein